MFSLIRELWSWSSLIFFPSHCPNYSLKFSWLASECLFWIIHLVRSRHINNSAALSFPTSHSLYMLSLTNIWLLQIEKKKVGIFDLRWCLCNKHQKWERCQPGFLETKKREEDDEKRGCWQERLIRKWQATRDLKDCRVRLSHVFLWPSGKLDEYLETLEKCSDPW